MLFNSIQFLIFFPIVILFYYLLPHKYRWVLLLLASYYFYMSWKPEYLILIVVSTVIDYLVALHMAKQDDQKAKRKFLYLSLISNLGILFLFKYFNFFSDSARNFFSLISLDLSWPELKFLLPVGISFYTFQTLGYTIDVYRGRIKPEKHLGIFAVYVAYFPQLVAGPIERAKNLLPQFYEKHIFIYDRVINGLRQMLLGFFKKVLVADNLATIVNIVYNNPYEHNAFSLVIATIFFAFQIYYDFSGYSDIAIGASRVMGIKLMKNFDNPYRSKSISEFWGRWHISLSTWFKDYLYIPLGGNRVAVLHWCVNILIVFLISGLWHGANWTFVVWGGLHGIYLVISKLSEKARALTVRKIGLANIPWLHNFVKITITFIMVNIGWIFFRANNIGDAFYIVKKIFLNFNFDFNLQRFQIVVFSSFILLVEVYCLLVGVSKIRSIFNTFYMRWLLYVLAIFMILFFGDFSNNKFLYFQF